MQPLRPTVIFASEAHAAALRAVLTGPIVVARTRGELAAATAQRGAIVFIDLEFIDQLQGAAVNAPVVALLDATPAEALPRMVRALDTYRWLSHIVLAPMLATPRAPEHLSLLIDRLRTGRQQLMLGANGVGRVALLARASRRDARFERMREFFTEQGVGARAITSILDVAEELVMNALYNAPSEAGYFATPRSRAEDVELPVERACEISYGFEDGVAMVRARDTFGALIKRRLLEVLNRCNAQGVSLDESRGGAGLGMWRIFSSASALTITVIPDELTDILVEINTREGRRAARPGAVHLFFGKRSHRWAGVPVLDDNQGLVEQSFTLIQAS